MSIWTRASFVVACGGCGNPIAVGKPVLRIAAGSTTLVRGGCCREAPPDLPPLVEQPAIDVRPMVHIRTGVGSLPLDFKALAAGREPGEDDE